MTFNTHCWLRLGDNLQHLQFVRRLALAHPAHQFHHYFAPHFANGTQLAPVVEDLPNVALHPSTALQAPRDSVDGWKGAENFWYQHPRRNDYVGFYIDHFDRLAVRLGLANPIRTARDFLFDYPALRLPLPFSHAHDVLIINSAPLSNQWRGYDGSKIDALIPDLQRKGHRVITSRWNPYCPNLGDASVTEIGRVSQMVDLIIMVSTGPSWPTFNIWTHDRLKFRLALIDSEDLSGLAVDKPDTYAQTSDIGTARKILAMKGWIQ